MSSDVSVQAEPQSGFIPISWKEAARILEQDWIDFGKTGQRGLGRKFCRICRQSWNAQRIKAEKNGDWPEEQPPVYPPTYEGCCLTCGSELVSSAMPF